MMEEALRALLVANGTLAGLVGTRITWGERVQGTAVPAVSMRVITGPETYHMGGPSVYREFRVQIDCLGKTYAAAKGVARAVDAVLSGHSGGDFQGVFKDGEQDLRQAGTNDPDALFAVASDYMVHYSE